MKIPTDRLLDSIEVVVLTHPSKPSCTASTLEELEIPYRIFSNADHNFPVDHPEKQISRNERPAMRDYALRQFRTFRGHQLLLSQSSKPYTMVFEDDMILAWGVSVADVLSHINAAVRFIDKGYDAVSFYGHNLSPPSLSLGLFDSEYIELSRSLLRQQWYLYFLQPVIAAYDGRYTDKRFRWHERCLAYLAGPTAKTKWIDAGHGHGMPRDLFLVNELRTLVMRYSIFEHSDQHGSVLTDFGRLKPFEE
jgi:hypothetical protein